MPRQDPRPTVVDLFAGCGGMSLGFERAGFKISWAADSWPAAVECYRANFSHPIHEIDLSDIKAVGKLMREARPDVIIGGPPCQDFSSAGERVERGRADLTEAYAQIVAQARPQVFVMENVARARLSRAYARARETLLAAGYEIEEVVLDASRYGVPQLRKRFFAIGSLRTSPSEVVEVLERTASDSSMTLRDYFGDRLGLDFYYRHPRNYSRRAVYSIDEPSPTVRGVNRPIPPGYAGHPLDAAPLARVTRPLTALERAEVQTFPRNFGFVGSKTDLELLVGNAVPVNLGNAVAEAVKQVFFSKSTKTKR